jgi:hypothetical protein
MKLQTLGTRGTDLVLAALRLERKFTRAELNEAVGKSRLGRGDVLPPHWQQSNSNELQRLSSDFAIYHKEGRQLDLLARVGSGQYCFRDEVRPRLIAAANGRTDLFVARNTLIVPVDGDDVVAAADNAIASHAIGKYAQQVIMTTMRNRGYRIIGDTSDHHAYDFMFQGHERIAVPQLMECKGTCRDSGAFSITHGEGNVLLNNPMNYWFGVVYGITFEGERASGGKVFVTDPPIAKEWRFTKGFRLERIRELGLLEAPRQLRLF